MEQCAARSRRRYNASATHGALHRRNAIITNATTLKHVFTLSTGIARGESTVYTLLHLHWWPSESGYVTDLRHVGCMALKNVSLLECWLCTSCLSVARGPHQPADNRNQAFWSSYQATFSHLVPRHLLALQAAYAVGGH
jgi:hypothetical protein